MNIELSKSGQYMDFKSLAIQIKTRMRGNCFLFINLAGIGIIISILGYWSILYHAERSINHNNFCQFVN
jgi:hypothetical protein